MAETRPQAPFLSPTDVWLLRGSQLAQILLLVAAFLTYWYQFLPLQRIASLDAQVEEKERQLRERNSELDRSYADIRALALREYVTHASIDCTAIGSLGTATPGAPGLDHVLDVDLGECLRAITRSQPFFKKLRIADQRHLLDQAEAVRLSVLPLRERAKGKLDEIEKLVKGRAELLPSPGGIEAELLACYAKTESPSEATLRRVKIASRAERSRLQQEYRSVVFDKIMGLSALKWP
jgi:hypothetical protein